MTLKLPTRKQSLWSHNPSVVRHEALRKMMLTPRTSYLTTKAQHCASQMGLGTLSLWSWNHTYINISLFFTLYYNYLFMCLSKTQESELLESKNYIYLTLLTDEAEQRILAEDIFDLFGLTLERPSTREYQVYERVDIICGWKK